MAEKFLQDFHKESHALWMSIIIGCKGYMLYSFQSFEGPRSADLLAYQDGDGLPGVAIVGADEGVDCDST